MISLTKPFGIPFDILEENYWLESSFCLSCERFSSLRNKEALGEKCPFCNEETLYDVDYLIKTGTIIGIE